MRRFILAPLAAALASFAGPAAAALDAGQIDRGIDACTDLYRHANGKWLASTAIPDDRTSWGTGAMVDKANEAILVRALEEALARPPASGTAQRKAVDYYRSGMDVAAIERAGLKPLAPVMQRAAQVKVANDLGRALAHLHARGIRAGFDFAVQADAKDSSRYLADVSQGGLGLPDRDYYFKDDERTRRQREAYVKHVARMLELSGVPAARAGREAKAVFAMETELARASRTRVELRDDEKNYNKRTPAQLEAAAPGFPWAGYFKALGAKDLAWLNVAQPDFFAAFARLAKERPAADWQAYLRWHTLRSAAAALPAAIEKESFAFNEAFMKGRKAQPPRFRHVIAVVSGPYGNHPMAHALARIYVDRAFSPQAKARALEMVGNIKAALGDRLRAVDWMGEETRARALEKLGTMSVKIGYPDRWRDFSDARISGASSFVENWMQANLFEARRDVARIGKPIDRGEWFMAPHMVNAYYNPSQNEIVFPAGILQPPFFDASADDALNYGAIGAVIGHEITHGFDDRGRKFDARGNLRDWWTEEDARRYAERAQRVVRQYSAFEAEGMKVNGQLTLGENLSDLGGLKIAYLALQKALRDKPREPIDGLAPEQRFFLSYAVTWRNLTRPEQERMRMMTGQHSLPRFRVRGPIAHMPEFAAAFSCDASTALLAEGERASIW